MKSKFSKYITSEISGLSHNIPLTWFKGFDPDDIEEGRLYFWIDENTNDILKSKVLFFVLQDRFKLTYFISEKFILSSSNKKYDIEQIDYDRYTSDYLEEIKDLPKDLQGSNFKEISQEEIIQILTKEKSSDVLQQNPDFSIYTDDMGYDVYENMIQSWKWENEKNTTHYSTAFFADENSQIQYLEKQLKIQLEDYEMTIITKEEVQDCIERIKKSQELNKVYTQNLASKQQILQKHPEIKAKLKNYQLKKFLEIDNLRIIDDDYLIDDNMVFDNQKESLLITGDLKVNGTLFLGKEESKNFFMVVGDTEAQNYVHNSSAYDGIMFLGNPISPIFQLLQDNGLLLLMRKSLPKHLFIIQYKQKIKI